MENRKAILANREAWDEVAALHKSANWDERIKTFSVPGASTLDDIETPILMNLGLRGKRVVHLCCNSGEELLSLANLGARDCVGFDISEEFISQAKELASLSSIPCEFILSDVYSIPDSYNQSFDLAYISVGTFGWMPDLQKFCKVLRSLLKPTGKVFIHETHPILDMYEKNQEILTPTYSYFRTDPLIDNSGLDYLGGTAYQAKPFYWFHHKMSDVIMCLINAGFTISSFEELPQEISATFPDFENQDILLPMSYILTGICDSSYPHY